MSGIFEVVGEFLANAVILGAFIGVFVRCGNIFIRAVSGKEDIL